MPRVLLLPALAVLSHPHLSIPVIVLGLLAAAAVSLLVAFAKPTRACPYCGGERVLHCKEWPSGRELTLPCKRCSVTGRVPRWGAVTVHRLYWAIRAERNRQP